MARKAFLLLLLLPCVLALLQCGGGSNSTPAATTPAPTSTTPTPTPTQTASGAYQATMFLSADGSSAPPRGAVTVNAQAENGSGTLQTSGGQPATSYQLQFCDAPGDCRAITTYTTDANGAANVSFQIAPGTSGTPGHYVGSLLVFQNGNVIYDSGADAQASGVSFAAPLIPGLPENPPGGGSVSISGQTLHVVLSGVPPNLNYEVLPCAFTPAGLVCNSFGTVTVNVDGQGNGAKDFALGSATFVGFIEVKNQFNQRYDSGFRAP